ncbi:MAG: hypothetical protein BM557_01765 [Flavobacterium sp. MedPE-SWcel]|uniref:T9SS type A sorting domain-containing protein n=1 Tax=uncultured Flavobacterium sp. TaxID=165435 RepID=UPI000914AD3E|nr:T9SS type A sorting domain-containing protein [uncultured Flavobacterium sp.]OIQ22128.1 MAG: hypothetical protein BM557_01765 [Flavobacterium sp. MedPE-SWcel]
MIKKIITSILFITTLYCNAQWLQLPQEIPNMQTVYFNDVNTGYIGTKSVDETLPKLFKTVDGGINWVEIQLPDIGNYTKITTIHFSDNNIGFLTTNDQLTSLRTTDNGQSWEQIFCGSEEYAGKAYFKNDGTGFYYTDEIDNNLFYTDNWGATWISKGDFYSIHDIYFLNNIGDIGYLQTEWSTYKTVDNGQTWQEISSVFEGHGNIFFYNENLGFIGSHSGMYKTINSGNNWSLSTIFKTTDIHFINENVGFNIGSLYTPDLIIYGHIYKTLDGGENWVPMYKMSNSENIDYIIDFSFPDSTTGYAIASDGHIYKLDVAASVTTLNKNKVTIYPIPANDILNINNIKELHDSSYQIVDLTGKIITKGTITGKTINIDTLAKGLYLLQIDGKQTLKFIKE